MKVYLIKKASIVIGIGLFLVVTVSCSNQKPWDPLLDLSPNQPMELVGSLNISLGDSVNTNPYFFQVYRSDSTDYFLFLNYHDYSIQFVDLGKGEITDVFYLEKEGPNGVSDLVSFYYHKSDSIFAIDRYKKLKLLNDKSEVYGEFNIGFSPDVQGYDGDIATDFAQQMLFKNGKFYYTNGNYRSSFKDPFLEYVDLAEDTIYVSGGFPAYYSNESFESKESFSVATTFNPNSNKLVYGFHIESDVMVRGINGKIEFVNTGIPALCIPCHESPFKLSAGKTLSKEQYQAIDERYFKNYAYLNLIYDETSNTYVRLLKAPTSDEVYENKPPPMKFNESDYYLVFLDGDTFQYLGNSKLSGASYALKPSGSILFASKGFLYVKKQSMSLEDENKMIFDQFKIRR